MTTHYTIPDIKNLNKENLQKAVDIFLDRSNTEYDIVTKIEYATGFSIKDILKLLESRFFNSYARFCQEQMNSQLRKVETEVYNIFENERIRRNSL